MSYTCCTQQCHFVCVGNSFSPITDCHTGVPQRSVVGPILFCLYISPIADIASQYGVSLQQYADNTQLYIACSVDDAASALSILESCLASLHSWFCHNGLALNPAKSEALLLGTRQRLSSFPIPVGIQTANSSVPISDHITTLARRHLGLKPYLKWSRFFCLQIILLLY